MCGESGSESNWTLDQVMEYTRAVGVEVLDMMVMMNHHIPEQEMFGGDGLCQFIQDHQDHLAQVEDQLGNLIMMMDWTCQDLQITNQVLNQDVVQIERLMDKHLVRVMVLEGTQGNLIEIPNSPALIPVPPPGGNLLVEIIDGMDDEVAQVIIEDQVEGQGLRVEGEEVRDLGVEGEVFEEGEDMLDVLRWMVARDQEILRYPEPPHYDDLNYIPDRQV